MHLYPSFHSKIPSVSALKASLSISEATLYTGLAGLCVYFQTFYNIYLFLLPSPQQKKTKQKQNCSSCSQIVTTLKLFQAIREALKSGAEVALLMLNCVSDDVIREWRKIRVTVIFSGLDVCSQACDNEACPCHHTLCSLWGRALQWKCCKESPGFNYPVHIYSYLIMHLVVFHSNTIWNTQ